MSGKGLIFHSIWLSFLLNTGIVFAAESGLFSWNIDDLMENSDVVLIGELASVPVPYEVLGKDFYRIIPDNVIIGSIEANSYLFIIYNVFSSYGRTPIIERSIRYMLFLKKQDLSTEGMPAGCSTYSLVESWKGSIPLDKAAEEKRGVTFIERYRDVRVLDSPDEFVEAIKEVARIRKCKLNNESAQMDPSLSEGAKEIYKKLTLTRSK